MKFKNLRNVEKSLIFRENFKFWKFNSLERAGYFIIFQGFEETNILKKISGNAMKLYIYLGLHSNNYEGIVWHSNKTIANYFGKSERTIRGWIKELEDLNLIKRMRLKYDGKVYTYLQPYTAKLENIDEMKEGIVYFNKDKELCFQQEFESRVLKLDKYDVEIYFEEFGFVRGELNKVIDGYTFESLEKNIVIELSYLKSSDLLLLAKLNI